MSKMTTARAVVTVTLELRVSGSWGEDCTIAQVYRQAEASARGIIRNKLGTDVQIKGEPKVTAVMAES